LFLSDTKKEAQLMLTNHATHLKASQGD